MQSVAPAPVKSFKHKDFGWDDKTVTHSWCLDASTKGLICLISSSIFGTISSASRLQPSVASVKYFLAVLHYTSQLTSAQILTGLTSICRRSTFFMLLGSMYLGSFREFGHVEHGFQMGFKFCLLWVDRFGNILDINMMFCLPRREIKPSPSPAIASRKRFSRDSRAKMRGFTLSIKHHYITQTYANYFFVATILGKNITKKNRQEDISLCSIVLFVETKIQISLKIEHYFGIEWTFLRTKTWRPVRFLVGIFEAGIFDPTFDGGMPKVYQVMSLSFFCCFFRFFGCFMRFNLS